MLKGLLLLCLLTSFSCASSSSNNLSHSSNSSNADADGGGTVITIANHKALLISDKVKRDFNQMMLSFIDEQERDGGFAELPKDDDYGAISMERRRRKGRDFFTKLKSTLIEKTESLGADLKELESKKKQEQEQTLKAKESAKLEKKRAKRARAKKARKNNEKKKSSAMKGKPEKTISYDKRQACQEALVKAQQERQAAAKRASQKQREKERRQQRKSQEKVLEEQKAKKEADQKKIIADKKSVIAGKPSVGVLAGSYADVVRNSFSILPKSPHEPQTQKEDITNRTQRNEERMWSFPKIKMVWRPKQHKPALKVKWQILKRGEPIPLEMLRRRQIMQKEDEDIDLASSLQPKINSQVDLLQNEQFNSLTVKDQTVNDEFNSLTLQDQTIDEQVELTAKEVKDINSALQEVYGAVPDNPDYLDQLFDDLHQSDAKDVGIDVKRYNNDDGDVVAPVSPAQSQIVFQAFVKDLPQYLNVLAQYNHYNDGHHPENTLLLYLVDKQYGGGFEIDGIKGPILLGRIIITPSSPSKENSFGMIALPTLSPIGWKLEHYQVWLTALIKAFYPGFYIVSQHK